MQLLIGTSKTETLDVSAATESYEIQALGGHDVVYGSNFADLIIGGPGYDQLFGNAGDDTFVAEIGDANADIVNGGEGFDTILGTGSNDILLFRGITSIERIDGGGGTDILHGTDNANFWNFSQTQLIGIGLIELFAGNDQLTGSSGNERIVGGAGNDTLDGGAGTDIAVYGAAFATYTLTALSGGQLRVDAGAGIDGVDTIKNFESIEFADGIYSSGVFTPFANPNNNAPVALADAYSATEDQTLVVNAAAGVLGNDTDPDDDPLTVASFDALSAHGGSVTMLPNGSFNYTAATNFHGPDSFSYIVSDGQGGTDSASVSINVAAVNDAPNAVNNSYTTTQDSPLVVTAALGVLANDTDADGDTLSVMPFSANSAQGGTVAMNANGSFSYTPPAGFTGSDSFSYSASDGITSDDAVVMVTVSASGNGLTLLVGTSKNDALDVSTGTEAYEIRALGGHDVVYGSNFADLVIGGPGADQLFGNAGDDTFVAEIGDANADIVNGGEGFDTILGTGSNDILLFRGITSIERIDGGGGTDILHGTDNANFWNFSQTQLIGIGLIELFAGNDQLTGSSGNERIVGGAGNDTLDGGAGTDIAVYGAAFATYTLTALSGGQLRVDAGAGIDGVDTIKNFESIEFADGIYSSGVFTPFANPNNNAPVALADAYSATEDQTLVVNAAAGVLGNDTDPDDDPLTVASFDALSAHGGSVTMLPNGSFNYTAATNFHGPDSFSYIVSDGQGGTDSASVSINVAAVNDAPNAVNNSYTTTQDSPLVVTAALGVLANDTDADGDTLSVMPFSANSAQGGTVAMNANGSFSYTPPAGFTGSDSFSYSASDGEDQDAALVSISVGSVPPPAAEFESIISALPENEWVKLNTNRFQDAWVPKEQRPQLDSTGSPGSIILAWGSATWDSNRNEYIIWGGGHANYEGNEVYTWSAASLQWERASLPSQVVEIADAHLETIDGWEYSPISSHAYDNLEFLEVADRMINFGGAAAHIGGAGFVETDGETKTGPYFWDPSKADPNKVGGLTGSHVKPELFPNVVGGEMWENRQTWGDISPIPGSMAQGTTDYALIDGVDVVFVNSYTKGLYKYTVPDVNDPTQDTWEYVGKIWDPYSGQGAGAFDASRNIYARTTVTEFTYWDLDTAGPTNRNVSFVPIDPSGEFVLDKNWGMEYDPVRERFVLWEGDASIWYLNPPDVLGANGWSLERAPAPTQPAPVVPEFFKGVLGKWDYVEQYDIFIGVTDHINGDIWAYKPEGWTPAADWL